MADTKYTKVSDLIYSNPENTAVLMTVTFESNPVPVRFNATSKDPMDYGRKLCEDALAGKFGPIQKYVPLPLPTFTKEQCKQVVQSRLDKTAKEYGFDSMLSAVSYRGYPNPYEEIAIKLSDWRIEVWTFVESMLDKMTVDVLSTQELEKLLKNIPSFVK